MTDENRRHNLEREWLLSEEAWQDAELLLEGGRARGSLARFYYATFHAVGAALLARGIEVSRHAGARSQFSEQFVKPGAMPADFGRLLASMQQLREDADYEREVEIDLEQARAARADATRVRDAIREWLVNHGWLSAS